MARPIRIYTRTGDAGLTGLADGSRVRKSHPRVEALGALDELNAAIGLVRAQDCGDPIDRLLEEIQQRLFDLGGELAHSGRQALSTRDVETLERAIDALSAPLPPLDRFVLPGGPPAAAQAHHARAVCRRAERRLWRLDEDEKVNTSALHYLNRLSDLLFVVARRLIHDSGASTPTWKPRP